MKKAAVSTVKDAAARFNRTTGRIRKICIDHDIGESIEGRIRFLTERDMDRIERAIDKDWRKKSSES
jgi:hypothetical protein